MIGKHVKWLREGGGEIGGKGEETMGRWTQEKKELKQKKKKKIGKDDDDK